MLFGAHVNKPRRGWETVGEWWHWCYALCLLSTIRSHSAPNLSTNKMQQSMINQKKKATCFACWVSVGYYFICNSTFLLLLPKEQFVDMLKLKYVNLWELLSRCLWQWVDFANNHLLDFIVPSCPNTFSHSLFVRALKLPQRNLPPHMSILNFSLPCFSCLSFLLLSLRFIFFSFFYWFTLYQENVMLFITKQWQKNGVFWNWPKLQ